MSVSILVVDDGTDVAELFRRQFRREARQGTYVLHFAYSGEQACRGHRAATDCDPVGHLRKFSPPPPLPRGCSPSRHAGNVRGSIALAMVCH